MRTIILFFVGLVVGIVGCLIAYNAMNRQTPWTKATMAVMGHQLKSIDESVKASRCTTADIVPHLQTLRLVANDIEPAFKGEIDQPQFGRYAADLRAAADTALIAPPATCKTANDTLSSLGKACDSCHRDFRG
jgi:cytochrome c556